MVSTQKCASALNQSQHRAVVLSCIVTGVLQSGDLTLPNLIIFKLEKIRFVRFLSQIREHISNMNFHSWVVLGSRGCREKKIQTAIGMLHLRPVFYVFMEKTIFKSF